MRDRLIARGTVSDLKVSKYLSGVTCPRDALELVAEVSAVDTQLLKPVGCLATLTLQCLDVVKKTSATRTKLRYA